MEIEKLFNCDFLLNGPGTESDIAITERALGVQLPEDYKSFMLQHDGGEGFIGNHYIIIWKISGIVKNNREYEIPIYAPGFVIFGSTGGGDGFGFDTRTFPYTVVEAPFIGMSHRDSYLVANSFNELLRRMNTVEGSLF